MEGFQPLDKNQMKTMLERIHRERIWIQFKFSDSGVRKCRTEEKGWGLHILAGRPVTVGRDRNGEAVTGNFFIGGRLIFFRAKMAIDARRLNFDLMGPMYALVRRKNRRFNVPAAWEGSLVTRRIGDRIVAATGRLLDLSVSGGAVGFHATAPTLKSGDRIQGHLRLRNRQPLTFEAVVRHRRGPGKNARYAQTVGFQIIAIEDLARFEAWMLDLQREAARTLPTGTPPRAPSR